MQYAAATHTLRTGVRVHRVSQLLVHYRPPEEDICFLCAHSSGHERAEYFLRALHVTVKLLSPRQFRTSARGAP